MSESELHRAAVVGMTAVPFRRGRCNKLALDAPYDAHVASPLTDARKSAKDRACRTEPRPRPRASLFA